MLALETSSRRPQMHIPTKGGIAVGVLEVVRNWRNRNRRQGMEWGDCVYIMESYGICSFLLSRSTSWPYSRRCKNAPARASFRSVRKHKHGTSRR